MENIFMEHSIENILVLLTETVILEYDACDFLIDKTLIQKYTNSIPTWSLGLAHCSLAMTYPPTGEMGLRSSWRHK